MTRVHAGQHVYTNVEKEQSPHKRGGWQTLFYTLSFLSEAESEEIEAHLFYTRSEQAEPVKRVFFSTSTGKRVVAQIVPLTEGDRYARRLSLAHYLVFAPDHFTALENNPFRVFRHFSFIKMVAEALDSGDFRTGDIPSVSVEFPEELEPQVEVAKAWDMQALKRLIRLALRADRLALDGSVVALVGEPHHLEHAVEATFLAVPTPLRPFCSFDTHFRGGNIVATSYLAVGLPQPPVGPRYVVVDAWSRSVQDAGTSLPETAYERWLMTAMESGDLVSISHQREHAFTLCEWLDGHLQDPSLVDVVPPRVVASVFQANPQLVCQRLQERLAEHLSSVMANRIFEQIYQQMRLLHACWVGDRKQMRQDLERLSEDDYRQFVRDALRFGVADPFACLVPGQGRTFLDLYLSTDAIGRPDLVSLVRALLEAREASCVARLIPHLHECSAREVQALEKIVDQHPDLPEEFRSAVAEATAALPPARGLKGMLKSLLRSFKDRGTANK